MILIDFALWLAPGAVVTGLAIAAWRTARRIGGWIHDRRDQRRGLRRLQQYANHPGSRAVLDDFHQPRKEDRP